MLLCVFVAIVGPLPLALQCVAVCCCVLQHDRVHYHLFMPKRDRFGTYKALFGTYWALFVIYKAIFGTYRALYIIFRALFVTPALVRRDW